MKKIKNTNKKDIALILSIVSLTPIAFFIIYYIITMIFSDILFKDYSASNSGALGMLYIFIFTILCIPCLLLSVLAFIKNINGSKRKLTFILSLIGIAIWSFFLRFII